MLELRITLLACVCIASSSFADPMAREETKPKQIPKDYEIQNYKISENVIQKMNSKATKDSQIDYLISTLNGDSNKIDRCSAARLLGTMKPAQAIRPLVSSLTLRDEEHKAYPAAWALVNIGTNSVPEVIKAIDASNDAERTTLAVQVIVEIMGKRYSDYIKQNEKSFSPKVKDALLRFGVRD